MKHLGYIADTDGILLWFPSQNRTFSVPKPSFYGFRPKTVRSPSQNRTFLVRKPYGFGTENVKRRVLETDSIPFDNTLIQIMLNNYIR